MLIIEDKLVSQAEARKAFEAAARAQRERTGNRVMRGGRDITPTSSRELRAAGGRANFERDVKAKKIVSQQVIQTTHGVSTNIIRGDGSLERTFIETPNQRQFFQQQGRVIQGSQIVGFAPAPVNVQLPIVGSPAVGFLPSNANAHPINEIIKLVSPNYNVPEKPAGQVAIDSFFDAMAKAFGGSGNKANVLNQQRQLRQNPPIPDINPTARLNVSDSISVSVNKAQPIKFGSFSLEELQGMNFKPKTPTIPADNPFNPKRGGSDVLPIPPSGGGGGVVTAPIFETPISSGGGFPVAPTAPQPPTVITDIPSGDTTTDNPPATTPPTGLPSGGGGFPTSNDPTHKCRNIFGQEVPCGGGSILDTPAGGIIGAGGNLLWLLLLILLLASSDKDKRRKGAEIATRRLR